METKELSELETSNIKFQKEILLKRTVLESPSQVIETNDAKEFKVLS
jgi:hypothetical protein